MCLRRGVPVLCDRQMYAGLSDGCDMYRNDVYGHDDGTHIWIWNMPNNSATGTQARVARVRAEYPNQLDYSGRCFILLMCKSIRQWLMVDMQCHAGCINVLGMDNM